MPNILSIISVIGGAVMSATFAEVLKRIETADDYEIQEIMDAVRKRFAVVFPDWEVVYVSCPRNNKEERQKILDFISRYFCS